MTERAVKVIVEADGTLVALAPSVGAVVDLPEVGAVVVAGGGIGAIETLSLREPLVAPATLAGRVVERLIPATTRAYVGYGTPMLRLDPRTTGGDVTVVAKSAGAADLVFRAPMSGRFYSRSAPTKPPLVEVGAVIATGDAIGLLEVMKTFHRVVFGGEGLPDRARVVRVVPTDGDDVLRGGTLLELEPA